MTTPPSSRQLAALRILYDDGPLTTGDLSTRLSVSRQRGSQVAARLVSLRLALRHGRQVAVSALGQRTLTASAAAQRTFADLVTVRR